jgi:hypothetical protein
MVFAGLMMLLMYELPIGTVCLAWSIVALTYLFGSAYSGKGCYLSIASIAAVCAAARIVFINLLGQAYGSSIGTGIVFPVMAIGILYAGNVFYLYSKDTIEKKDTGEAGILRMLTRSPRLIMGLMATLALTSIVIFKVDRSLITVGLGLEGVGLFLAGLGVREKNWRLYGLVVLLAAVVKTFLVDLRNVGTLYYILSLIVLGILLLFVSFMYTKYKDKLKRLL